MPDHTATVSTARHKRWSAGIHTSPYALAQGTFVPRTTWRIANKVLELMARRLGRFLYKTHVNWLVDPSWAEPYNEHLVSAGRPPLGRDLLDRRFTLSQFARAVAGLEGSTAECGVLGGVGSSIICLSLRHTYGPDDRHFAFDSFEGLAEPTEEDRDRFGRHWWARGDFSEFSDRPARAALAPFPFARVVKGWIPDGFAAVGSERFRFVHVDVDLYDATRDCLEFFYSRMVPGGILFFDDYGFESCRGARQAVREFLSGRPEPIIELATGQSLLVRSFA
jgi:O-methyltransferase